MVSRARLASKAPRILLNCGNSSDGSNLSASRSNNRTALIPENLSFRKVFGLKWRAAKEVSPWRCPVESGRVQQVARLQQYVFQATFIGKIRLEYALTKSLQHRLKLSFQTMYAEKQEGLREQPVINPSERVGNSAYAATTCCFFFREGGVIRPPAPRPVTASA